MAAIALEDRVLAHSDLDVEIARRPAVATRLSFSGQANPIARIDTGWHLDVERLLLAHPSLPQTRVAGLADRLTSPLAARTGLLNRKEALLDAYLPDAVTG